MDQSVCDGVVWVRKQISAMGSHVFAWLKNVARDVASAFRSVSGLSMMLYMAESINVLVREVMNHLPQYGRPFKPFDKSQFDKVVWATRIFTDPYYYVGGGIEADLRKGCFFTIASNVLGTLWNGLMFVLWLEEQGCQMLVFIVSKTGQNGLFSWVRHMFEDKALSGISILSYTCMFAERVREIMNGKHVLFSVIDAASELLEAVSAVLALVPLAMPLPAAILQAVAAGVGTASYFLDPGT
jgi:hypothetical protein